MTAPKKEFIALLSRVATLTPTPTIVQFAEMRKQKDFLALTEAELLQTNN